MPENLVLRDKFVRPVLRQPAHSPHPGSIQCLLTGCLPLSATAFMYLYRQTPSGQSRVCQVTLLHTDGIHYRESTRTGPQFVLFVCISLTADGPQRARLPCDIAILPMVTKDLPVSPRFSPTNRGPLVPSIIPVKKGCCLFRYHHGTNFVRLSFPTSTIGTID